MIRRALTLVFASTIFACSVQKLPAPAAPANVVPNIPDVPDGPPPEGMGRLLIDSGREPAKVARVIEAGPVRQQELAVNRLPVQTYSISTLKTELLCITPCAVDLRTGAHTLQLTSTREPERTSTADVAVARGTTVVRHELGSERRSSNAYATGVHALFVGTGLTLMGGLSMLRASTHEDPDALKPFVTLGAVIGTVGIGAVVTGIILMSGNRPAKRPGATTTFALPQGQP
jgi:hypothetical protein